MGVFRLGDRRVCPARDAPPRDRVPLRAFPEEERDRHDLGRAFSCAAGRGPAQRRWRANSGRRRRELQRQPVHAVAQARGLGAVGEDVAEVAAAAAAMDFRARVAEQGVGGSRPPRCRAAGRSSASRCRSHTWSLHRTAAGRSRRRRRCRGGAPRAAARCRDTRCPRGAALRTRRRAASRHSSSVMVISNVPSAATLRLIGLRMKAAAPIAATAAPPNRKFRRSLRIPSTPCCGAH